MTRVNGVLSQKSNSYCRENLILQTSNLISTCASSLVVHKYTQEAVSEIVFLRIRFSVALYIRDEDRSAWVVQMV
jgi:hypothetical protein